MNQTDGNEAVLTNETNVLPTQGEKETKVRDIGIDFMRGILTFLMVIAHIYQFFPQYDFMKNISTYVDLTTFSGFMFCFGYVSFSAYSQKEKPEKRMLIGMLKSLAAFYISSIAFSLLIADNFGVGTLINILLMRWAPGYCEFLISFTLIYLLEIFFFKPLCRLAENKIKYFLLIAICLFSTGFAHSSATDFPPLGTLFGSNGLTFPLLQYGAFFLVGLYFSKNKITFNTPLLIATAVCSSLFFVFRIKHGYFPNRFPPSLLFIFGSTFFLYGYFLLSRLVKKEYFFSFIGKHTLLFLVTSNLLIFTAKYCFNNVAQTSFNMIWLVLFVLSIGLPFGIIYAKKTITDELKVRSH